MQEIVTLINSYLWGWPMMILLMGTHLFLTFRLKLPQRHIFKAIRYSVSSEKGAEGDVSPFGALATTLAGTIGTGNIVGVATAVALGGPGAVLWCWVTGLFGIATKYAEALLSVKFRTVNSKGEMAGGPMYVLERGLKARWAGVLFSFFGLFSFMSMGCLVQSNSIALLSQSEFGVSPFVVGAVLSLLVAVVVLFGIKGIARVSSFLVPLMTLFYVFGCLYILFLNRQFLGETIQQIFCSAFTSQAAGGGFAGSTLMIAARYGIARGLFSNESGLGTSPILAAAARTSDPVRQALVSSTSTFWDTVVVCAITGLVIVSSIIAHPDINQANGAALTHVAFAKIPFVGTPILIFGLMTFTFSTILGYCYLGEKTLSYLGGDRMVLPFRLCWIVLTFLGSLFSLNFVWDLADMFNALMAIPNLISLLLLSSMAARETKRFHTER